MNLKAISTNHNAPIHIFFTHRLLKINKLVHSFFRNTLFKIKKHLKKLHICTVFIELSYRIPKPVNEVLLYPSSDGFYTYPICPTCKVSFEREYQSYCDRCGQKLDWTGFNYNTCTQHFKPH